MPGSPPARQPARQGKPPAGLAKKTPGAKKAPGVLKYAGASYDLTSDMGVWPLLQFARAAESGLRPEDPRGLAAIHAFLQDVIDPNDWGRFQEDMIAKKVTDIGGLMTAAQQAVNEMLDRLQAANGEAKRPVGDTADQLAERLQIPDD